MSSVRTKLDSYKLLPKWVRYLSSYLNLLLCTVLLKTKVHGRNNIPKNGPYIIAINHFHIFDPALVAYAIRKPISFLAASDQDVKWDVVLAGKLYGFIPTNRQKLAPSTIKKAIKVLQNNEILGIFPEATTGPTLRKPKKGVTYLSLKSDCKILPMSVLGLDKNIWQQWFRGIRPEVTVKVGKAFSISSEMPSSRAMREKKLAEIGNDIMQHIAALLPTKFHGEYLNDIK
jgi:1-acyl-sn-glycerol-3-phosphate acyltransferase